MPRLPFPDAGARREKQGCAGCGVGKRNLGSALPMQLLPTNDIVIASNDEMGRISV